MPGTTPVSALPYPVPDDSVDVPRDVQALAVKLDPIVPTAGQKAALAGTSGSPGDTNRYVTAADVRLGTAGVLTPAQFLALGAQADGTTCRVLADATNGIIWTLRYRAASASTYKWEFVGGSALRAVVETVETTGTSGTWVDLATVGPSITVPLAGDYDVFMGVTIVAGTAGQGYYVSLSIGGAAPAVIDLVLQAPGQAQAAVARTDRRSGLAATSLLMRYFQGAAGGQWSRRHMTATPVRVTGP